MIYKIVITGPSSSGKTSLIKELKFRGFPILEEAAHEVLEKFKKLPNLPETIELRQYLMMKKQTHKELVLNHDYRADINRTIVLDRGIHDYVGFTQYYLGKEKAPMKLLKRYDKVFCLDATTFDKDDLRVEMNIHEARKIFSIIKEMYLDSGNTIVEVPNFSDDEKTNIKLKSDFIIDKMKELNLYYLPF
jgi:predicted ATPase